MFKQLTSHCGIRLALALSPGLPLPALAQWPELVDTLPGVDARGVGWNAQGPWVLSDVDLRRLRLDEGPGGLLLQQRRELAPEMEEAALGDHLAAWRGADSGLRVMVLETGTVSIAQAGISTLAQGGQTILAAGASGLWQGRLDQPTPAFEQVLGAFSFAPTALCGREGLAWLVAADTLCGYGLGDPPLPLGRRHLPGVQRLAEHEDRLLACLGAGGLQVVDLADPFVPVAWPWQLGFPVLDAVWWREQVFALAAGDSGLALADFSDPGAPQLLGRWRTVLRADRLSLKGDSLLVAEGAAGVSLHVLRDEGGNARPELLARHATRPHILAIQNEHGSMSRAWMLDRDQGFRRFVWPEWPETGSPVEEGGVSLPLPVDGGDWRDGLIAGCRFGAGLRYYQETESGIVLRGINPGDPVKLLAWGPDDLIAYVTPQAFVAIKQANRNPWFVLHHGTINLQAEPLCAAWTDDRRLFVGCADGRLLQVDVTTPLAPVLEQALSLAGPVRSLSVMHVYDSWETPGLAVAADKLYLLERQTGSYALVDSIESDQGNFTSVAINEMWGLAGMDNPPRVCEISHGSGQMGVGGCRDVPASPLAVGRRYSDAAGGFCWAALDNGDLLYLEGNDEVGIGDLPSGVPGGLALAAHPNPFNPVTRLSFVLDAAVDEARLTVHDIAGRLVTQRELGPLPAGQREISLTADGWPSGLYLARLEAGDRTALAKLLLIH